MSNTGIAQEEKMFNYKNAIDLFNVINKIVADNLGKASFKLKMVLNQKILQQIVEPVNKATAPTENYKKYLYELQQLRVQLCNKHAQKDQNGHAKVQNNQFVILNKLVYAEDYKAQSKILEQKYKEEINSKKEIQEQLLNSKYDIFDSRFKRIPSESLPDELTTEQIKILIPLID